MAYAVADVSPSGHLTRSYCLIQRAHFISATDPDQQIDVMLCSCDQSLPQREWLLSTEQYISEPMSIFHQRERLVMENECTIGSQA